MDGFERIRSDLSTFILSAIYNASFLLRFFKAED